MADSRLNDFVSRGTNAERLAFTPTPPTPAGGNDPGYFFYETDTGDTYAWDGAAWAQINTGAGAGDMLAANNLSDVASAATSRANLGVNKLVISAIIDGGGSTITTGLKGYSDRIPAAHTITKVTALSVDSAGPATSCSITVDVWADTYTNFPPTSADKISASAPVTLSSATKSEDSTLTGWTTSISANSIYGFSVASVTGAKKIQIIIEATF